MDPDKVSPQHATVAEREKLQQEQTVAINEQLVIAALRQQELTEAAENLNQQLREENLQRRRAEQALRESEERCSSLVSVVTDVTWSFDPEGAFSTPQTDWQGYTGQAWEQHRHFGWVMALHPEDRERVLGLWCAARDSGSLFQAHGRIWHAPSQQWRYFTAKATPLINGDGSIREWVGACTDIDAQKRAEEHLEAIVAERTAQLREKVGELEIFSYSVSHDLRGPLRALRGFSDLLLEEHASTLKGKAVDYLKRISTAARRMDQLIEDVLSYTRVVGKEMRLKAVDLDELVHQILESYPQLQGEEVDFGIAERLPSVLGHEASLTQCLSNLLANAVKFVAPGVRPKIKVGAETTDTHVRLWIEDNGIGIAPQHHERIFAIFERVVDREAYDGTGMGLAIVRKAVQRMNGRVGVESTLGQGSKFWVELQKAPTNEPAAY